MRVKIYPTKDPKVLRARVWYKGKPIERQIKNESGRKVTQAEAEAYGRKLITEIEAASGKPVESRVVPHFSDFCSEGGKYHTYIFSAGRLKASTARNRKYQLATLIEYFGEYPINQIDVELVEGFQGWRSQADAKTGRKAGKPSTINDDVKALRAVLAFAGKRGVDVKDLSAVEDLPERGEQRAKAWNGDEIKRLLDAAWAEGRDFWGLVLCLLNTGMRKGEAINLTWNMVDLKAGLINLEGNEAWTPKSEQPREIPISTSLATYLAGAKERAGNRSHVFVSDEGTPYAFWPQRVFDRAVATAKLTGGPHKSRHTYASHFLANCEDLDLLRRILGHSTIKVTEKLYVHMVPGRLDKARNAVNIGDEAPAEAKARTQWAGKPAKRTAKRAA